MNIVLIVLLVIAVVFFVWQSVLFVKDLIKHIKTKRSKKMVDNPSEDGRKDDNRE